MLNACVKVVPQGPAISRYTPNPDQCRGCVHSGRICLRHPLLQMSDVHEVDSASNYAGEVWLAAKKSLTAAVRTIFRWSVETHTKSIPSGDAITLDFFGSTELHKGGSTKLLAFPCVF